MLVAVYSSKPYDEEHLLAANTRHGHELRFFRTHLDEQTATLAEGARAVCVFVNDQLTQPVLRRLRELGVRLIALRCAGFNNVDVAAAASLGLTVARVPAYSPDAVAEHAVGLILSLNRKLHRAYARVREGNFSLDGLCGFDVRGKVVGIVGTGTIGVCFARIMAGFGCRLLAFDPKPNPDCIALGAEYVSLSELLAHSDIISLHCPLLPATRHIIDERALAAMKPGAMLINTGRGGLVDTAALIRALKSRHLGCLGLDVYEEEESLFFDDHSSDIIDDDVFARLLTFPNVLITAHQGFLTNEALDNISRTTLSNITNFEQGTEPVFRVASAEG